MRFHIKKLLEGFDPADLMEQSMYCFGSDSSDGDDGSTDMGLDSSVADQASTSGTSTGSNDMGMDSSVADQASVQGGISQGVSGQENSQGSASYGTNSNPFGGRAIGVAYSPTINALSRGLASTNSIDPYGINQTQAQNMATNIGLATMANFGLSPDAMNSIGTTGYSTDDVTGFGGKGADGRDVSNYSTDLDSLSNMEDEAKKGTVPSIVQAIAPFGIGKALNQLSKMSALNTISNISKGYAPTYSNGQITGTSGYGIGMGQPNNDMNMSGAGRSVDGYGIFSDTSPSEVSFSDNSFEGGNDSDPIVPATRNPVSGQAICPDGYRFDDDLQACRLDTTSNTNLVNANPYPSGDQYYRASSLDNAPVNMPSGFDFNSANNNFVNQFAYRPSNYQNQMGLNGFTPFRSS
jgi:hypothetical protein|tara:strand:+ start:561 stop:1784 length:1224 start_codon:yes stop_codon:yes gene_type:complete